MSVMRQASMFGVLYQYISDWAPPTVKGNCYLEVDPRRYLMYPLGPIFHFLFLFV